MGQLEESLKAAPVKPVMSEIQGVTYLASMAEIEIATEASQTYRIEYSVTLQPGDWQSAPPIDGTGGMLTLTYPIDLELSSGFFRVVTAFKYRFFKFGPFYSVSGRRGGSAIRPSGAFAGSC